MAGLTAVQNQLPDDFKQFGLLLGLPIELYDAVLRRTRPIDLLLFTCTTRAMAAHVAKRIGVLLLMVQGHGGALESH